MERMDQLWPGGYRFYFDDTLFQPSTDSFLLGSFPKLHRGDRVCDLGAGTGLLGLLLLAREPSLHVTNVERQAASHALSVRNAALNGLDRQVTCLHGDLRDKAQLPTAGSFDLVVSNPPYFPAVSGLVSPQASRRDARSEVTCTLGEVCAAAARLLRYGGRFAVVFRPDRLVDLTDTLRQSRLEPKRLRFVQHTAAGAPSLLLLEARKGGRPGLTVEPPLLHYTDGAESAEWQRMYFRDKE